MGLKETVLGIVEETKRSLTPAPEWIKALQKVPSDWEKMVQEELSLSPWETKHLSNSYKRLLNGTFQFDLSGELSRLELSFQERQVFALSISRAALHDGWFQEERELRTNPKAYEKISKRYQGVEAFIARKEKEIQETWSQSLGTFSSSESFLNLIHTLSRHASYSWSLAGKLKNLSGKDADDSWENFLNSARREIATQRLVLSPSLQGPR